MAGLAGCRPPQADGGKSRMSGWLRCPARACAWSEDHRCPSQTIITAHASPLGRRGLGWHAEQTGSPPDPAPTLCSMHQGVSAVLLQVGNCLGAPPPSTISWVPDLLVGSCSRPTRFHCTDQQGPLPVLPQALLLGASQLLGMESCSPTWRSVQAAPVTRPGSSDVV